MSGRTGFDSRESIAREVSKLTLDDIRTLYQHAINDGLYSWLLFSKGGELNSFSNVSTLKRDDLPLFPPVTPGKEAE